MTDHVLTAEELNDWLALPAPTPPALDYGLSLSFP